MFKKKTSLILLVLLLGLTMTACSYGITRYDHIIEESNSVNNNIDKPVSGDQAIKKEEIAIKDELVKQGGIEKFKSLEELKEFLSKNNSPQVLSRANMTFGKGINIESINDSAMLKNVDREVETESTSMDYSKTNIQEENVDEPDIIKTDGEYIYAVSNKTLFVIKAYAPEDSKIISRIKFKYNPSNIFINENRLVVYGNEYNKFKQYGEFTFLKVFDITNKEQPKQVRDLDFEGSYFDSRMIGDYVYFITSKRNYSYRPFNGILPIVAKNGKILEDKCSSNAKCILPNIYYFNIPYDSYNFTTITAINIKDNEQEINKEIYVFSGSQKMYVSKNNIYITYTKHLNQYEVEQKITNQIVYPSLSKAEQNKIDKIENVEDFILSKSEKINKISNIVELYIASLEPTKQNNLRQDIERGIKTEIRNMMDELEKTVIHKIAINKNNLEYKTSGEVKGYVLNQFSMSEQNGYFIIATTKNKEWNRYLNDNEKESYSNLYVLDKNLKIVGSVEKLAMGEKIYSVRFMQNRAYMTTFKQVDPLFVIDLTEPTNPKVLGKLKVPGYSSYLHPYDENFLIGIGKNTEVNKYGGVQTKGLKLSLFDVSNVKNPKEIDTYVVNGDWSDSIALNNHKAFLFSKSKNLLVLPVNIRGMADKNNKNEFSYKENFRGAMVWDINKKGFRLKGRIDHRDLNDKNNPNYYDNSVKRSLYIENTLYTFSNNKLKINKLSDLSLINSIEFDQNNEKDFEIIN